MLLPVKVEYNSREQQTLDGASKETRQFNECMDRIDANLDNLSDNLKQRFKQLVTSQLSLLKYQQENMYEERLNREEKIKKETRERLDNNRGISILRKQFSPSEGVKYITRREDAIDRTSSKQSPDRSTKSPRKVARIRIPNDDNVSVIGTEKRKKVPPVPPPRKPRVVSGRVSPTLDTKKAIVNHIQNTARANQAYLSIIKNEGDKSPSPPKTLNITKEVEPSSYDNERRLTNAIEVTVKQPEIVSQKSPILKEKLNSPTAFNIDKIKRSPTNSPTATVRTLYECREDKTNENSAIGRAYKAIANRREQQSKLGLTNVLPRGYKKEPPSADTNVSPVEKADSRPPTMYGNHKPSSNGSPKLTTHKTTRSASVSPTFEGSRNSTMYGNYIPSSTGSPKPTTQKTARSSSVSPTFDKQLSTQKSPMTDGRQRIRFELEDTGQSSSPKDALSTKVRRDVPMKWCAVTRSRFISPTGLTTPKFEEHNDHMSVTSNQDGDTAKMPIKAIGKSQASPNNDAGNIPSVSLTVPSNSFERAPNRSRSPSPSSSPTVRFNKAVNDIEDLVETKDDTACRDSCTEDVEVCKINARQTEKSQESRTSDKFSNNFTKVFAPRPYETQRFITNTDGVGGSKEQGQPSNRNYDLFGRESSPKDSNTTSRTPLDQANENVANLQKFGTKSDLLTTASPTRRQLNNENTIPFPRLPVQHITRTTEANISVMDDAYSAIKTSLYNSALTSLISTMKNTIQENVDNDFVREIWTALNKSVVEMTRDFRSFVNSLSLHDNNALNDDIDNLQALIEQMLHDPQNDLKSEVEYAMCRLGLHVKETQKNHVCFTSEVGKILDSLTNLTECLTMCGERIFHPKYQWRTYGHIPEKVEFPVKLNGFIDTAKTISQKLVVNYAMQTTDEKSANSYNKERKKFLDYRNNETSLIKQEELFQNNSDINQVQPFEKSVNHSFSNCLNWLNRRKINACRNYGFILVLIIGIAKFLALFGPECLQIVYDIIVGVMMYINCNIHLIHFGQNII